MTDTCPACGEEADAMVAIDMGDRWPDVFGKPPHSLFSQYQMVHAGGQQGQTLVLYLHSMQKA